MCSLNLKQITLTVQKATRLNTGVNLNFLIEHTVHETLGYTEQPGLLCDLIRLLNGSAVA